MPEYILVTDPDGVNRVVPKTAQQIEAIQIHNEGLGPKHEAERLKMGQTFPDEETANKYIAEHKFIQGYSPIAKVSVLQNVVKDQQTQLDQSKSEIEHLKALLAVSESKGQSQVASEPTATTGNEKLNVVDTLAKIRTLTTVPELEALLNDEDRETVINAVNKAITKIKIS